MMYTVQITIFDADAGPRTVEQVVASRDIKTLSLPDRTVSFHFPLPDHSPAPIYYIGRLMTKKEILQKIRA